MKKYYWLFFASISLLGCNQSLPLSKLQEQDAKINELSKKLEQTQLQFNLLKIKVSEISINDMFRNFDKIAFLKIGTTNFSPIVTEIGTITVHVADVEAFANGSKVTLVFGNPLSATITNVKFNVDYGTLDKDGVIKDGTEKTKEVSLPQPLNAASWNNVEVILESLPVNELGYIRVHDLNVSSISLYSKTRQQ